VKSGAVASPSEIALADAVLSFQAENRELATLLTRTGYPDVQAARLNAVASDVEHAAEILRWLHEEARLSWAKRSAKLARDPIANVLRDPKYNGDDAGLIKAWQAAQKKQARRLVAQGEAGLRRRFNEFQQEAQPLRMLSLSYKSFFIFVRAYQDAIYCVLNRTSAGSMSAVVKKQANPVRAILDEHSPAYAGWFEAFKKRRDRIKYGYAGTVSNIGSARGSGDFGLVLDTPPSGHVTFHLTDATEALVMSLDVVKATRLHFETTLPPG
jgi:hypothetical protein